MDLQRISLSLKRIGNVSKCIGNALQRIYNALKMHYNGKTLQRYSRQACFSQIGSQINKNSRSFKVFAGSQPGKYYPPPTDFDLESRPSPAFFAVVYW